MQRNIIAIGRSGYLYESILHLNKNGYFVAAIITDIAYEEYDIKHTDFEALAHKTGAAFFLQSALKEDLLKSLVERYNVEAAISVNWRYKIKLPVLQLLKHGILNFHLGSLPDYKGNATANWAILNGEDHIYGNVHRMEEDLDAGDVIVRKRFEIGENTYVGDIISESVHTAPELFRKALELVFNDRDFMEVKGSRQGSRCYPRLPEDSLIDWNQSVRDVHRLIRASSRPFKGAYTFFNEKKVVIWQARIVWPDHPFYAIPGHVVATDPASGSIRIACKDGFLEVDELDTGEVPLKATELVKSIRMRFRSKTPSAINL